MSRTFTLTHDQAAAFERVGVLRLPGFYAADTVAPMADAVWADLRNRYGFERDRPETWTRARPAQFQSLGRSGVFAGVASPELHALMDDLFGRGRWRLVGHPTPLVTFPTGAWEIPRAAWHIDAPADPHTGQGPMSLLRLFILLDQVAPRGGGTLYAAGSHRVLVNLAVKGGAMLRSAHARERLRRESAWFDAVWTAEGTDRTRRLMEEGAVVGGVAVCVDEMTGEAGDLILMHPAVLHASAPNARERPRLALAATVMTTA